MNWRKRGSNWKKPNLREGDKQWVEQEKAAEVYQSG
jgi:hypothetical protein